ncbi:MAG TPA: 2-C-methyl-D-erythritol 4-phosphate cytidylyltransferase [Solirubrobacteraceae bacterium]|nr:2-C-methyl-D-erythritol 4-phosphate cytidylyltransferase [Solirubrobacteraceae bacterium]
MATALIVAAGRGERLGGGEAKAFVALAGRPLLQWSIEALRAVADVQEIVVALPPGARAPAGVSAVEGGATRSESVARALGASGARDPAGLVLVHDAARPLVTARLAERALARLAADESADAAIAAVAVTDTIKRADGSRVVTETLERANLWAVQTPQVFRRGALERALDVPGEQLAQATDDAWLIERAGGKVLVVDGDEENLKVTTRMDLELAELLLARRALRRAERRGTPAA